MAVSHVAIAVLLGLVPLPLGSVCVAQDGSCNSAPGDTIMFQRAATAGKALDEEDEDISDEDVAADALQPTLVNGLREDAAGVVCTIPEKNGLKLYAWKSGGRQRCAAIYVPPDAPKPMPVMLWGNCYSKNRFVYDVADVDGIAEDPSRLGVAVVFFSDSEGMWRIPRKSFVSDAIPQKCDSKSPNGNSLIQYVDDILKFLESDRATYNTDKVSVAGFSQNSKWSALIGFCFSHKLLGVVQGGGGMNEKCSGQSCQYAPIYPCYEPSHSVTYCGFRYENDNLAKEMQPMYNRCTDEGYNAEMFTFPNGGHVWQQNKLDWIVGCTGMTEPCSGACEADVITCFKTDFPADVRMEGGSIDHARERAKRYTVCMTADRPASCSKGCSATLTMLSLIEVPASQLSQGVFGPPNSSTPTGPSSSKCVHSSVLPVTEAPADDTPTDDPATDEAGECKNYCPKHTTSWAKKCNWQDCNACADCEDEAPAEDTPRDDPATDEAGECKNYCPKHTASWAKKCNWQDCNACTDC